jgi:hypothetical protein
VKPTDQHKTTKEGRSILMPTINNLTTDIQYWTQETLLDFNTFIEEVGSESYGTNSIAHKSLLSMTDPTNKSFQAVTEESDKPGHTIPHLAVKTGLKEMIVGIWKEEQCTTIKDTIRGDAQTSQDSQSCHV